MEALGGNLSDMGTPLWDAYKIEYQKKLKPVKKPDTKSAKSSPIDNHVEKRNGMAPLSYGVEMGGEE